MLGLTLLLATATKALDQLCLLRMQRDLGVLTPEYLDPSLHFALEGPAGEDEHRLRSQLLGIAAQFQTLGSEGSLRAMLNQRLEGRKLLAMLALVGAGEWERVGSLPQGGELHRRAAADGQVYVLAGAPASPARHAPHAMRAFSQQLWLLPAGHPATLKQERPQEAPLLSTEEAVDSLSLDAALRDVGVMLQSIGADDLLRQIQQLEATSHQNSVAVGEPSGTPVAA